MKQEINNEYLKENIQYDENARPYIRTSNNQIIGFTNLTWIDNLLCNLQEKKENTNENLK